MPPSQSLKSIYPSPPLITKDGDLLLEATMENAEGGGVVLSWVSLFVTQPGKIIETKIRRIFF